MMNSFEQRQSSDKAQGEVQGASSRLRRRLLWTAGLIVLVLLLLLTPPLLNVSRLRLRIAASMSATLGRPVHLDGVTLQLLPIPGFTLQNLVVSEGPGFGNEPVIRAQVVNVTLRPSSLWRRQVELSRIRFVEPTLNLVRNARGEWNLQSLLMHAAQVNTAPTGQNAAGPAPRFPYVEATNGRINVKLDDEKQPFSLTEADFALWLPTAEQWRVRLVGKPARTDTNVAGTGMVRMEGELRRAAAMADVPVDLHMSWHDAPLGEASKLLTGSDAGWRGTLNVDATLFGPLSAAKQITEIHINDLRRADFVPPKLMNVNIECSGSFDMPNAIVNDASCTLPTPVPDGGKVAGQAVAIADTIALQNLNSPDRGVAGLRLGMTNVANSYVMDWARLFSKRIPPSLSPNGIAAGSVTYAAVIGWQGGFHSEWTSPKQENDGESVQSSQMLTLTANQTGLSLTPFNLMPAKLAPLMLSGDATAQGYELHLAGTATANQLNSLRGMLPPFGDGLEAVLPELVDGSDPPLKVNVNCRRAWSGLQSCAVPAGPPKPTPHHHK